MVWMVSFWQNFEERAEDAASVSVGLPGEFDKKLMKSNSENKTEKQQTNEQINLLGMTETELKAWCVQQGLPSFRGTQLFQWIQQKQVTEFSQMSNLSKEMRTLLAKSSAICFPRIIRVQKSRDGQTAKLLLAYEDGVLIETVVMVYERETSKDRRTICISTQAGCAMGCKFCATGIGGLERNLTAAEIVAQVLLGDRWCREQGLDGISNVVYMGMGEPLANLAQVLSSVEILNNEHGLGIGQRRMTISTCGLAPQIRKLAAKKLQVGLAVSLHGADNASRSRLMPINDRYPLEELMAACDAYTQETGRRISYEYALLKGINDRMEDARSLGQLLKGRLAHVNLIPVNYVPETGFFPTDSETIKQFSSIVEQYHVEVTLREKKGTDIDAACGQLRQREQEAASR